jgi:hypothetical protein
LLGGPLEVNMMAKSGNIMGPGSSSSNAGAHSTSGGPTSLSSGGASGAPRRVRSCSVAVYLVSAGCCMPTGCQSVLSTSAAKLQVTVHSIHP